MNRKNSLQKFINNTKFILNIPPGYSIVFNKNYVMTDL